MKLIGVDVGGTFTDVMYGDTESQEVAIHKVPTTPDDPSWGVIQGMVEICERFDVARGDIDHVLHGTTIATNAVLEYKGARTGMVTTEGYRDILHIGRHQRPQHYSIMQDVPWQDRPLVQRRHRKVVAERLSPPDGAVLTPLDEDAVRRAAQELKAAGVEAIAVCFLFAYINPAHEDRAAAIISEEYPGCFVTTSSSVSPQFREFERFTTAAMNAFIGPKVRTYVQDLEAAIADNGFGADLHVMGSNGGVATSAMVAERPVLTLLSGPAAGVLGGAMAGDRSDRKRLITYDVGGTSADIGLVVDGQFAEATARDTWIGGYPVMAPMIDIHTIGAGGGSIAYLDAGQAFRVGPQSAGAQPGPAAYGRGGTLPTVTDANVVLGRLQPGNFLGGEMSLDAPAAHKVMGELAEQLGLSVEAAADGVLTIINANMANAIRSRTVQKGHDPREFSLVAFGGAGPLHGVEVARDLGIPEVIIPPYPGITSAAGLLTTDLKYDAIRTEFQTSNDLDIERLTRDFNDMRDGLAAQFKIDGLDDEAVAYQRSGDLRYVGQGYELRVPVADGVVDQASLDIVFKAFEEIHTAEYGHVFEDSPIEIVNIRVTGIGQMPKIEMPSLSQGGDLKDALLDEAPCHFRVDGELAAMTTPLYARDKLPVGQVFEGPAIILQKDTTTIIPPGARATAQRGGNLLIETGA
ncbi:MAG: hydantoinase/oxoprolinase family protein [Alphaproteobacteria bacterium]|nr:hydantoinase/oxoprolinase family protein [Alphaproteobacteria bacterium]